MNTAHIKILTWEHYRRCLVSVIPFTLLISLPFVLILLYQYRDHAEDIYFAEFPTLSPLHASAAFNILLLLSTGTHPRDIQFNPNPYYLRLPINMIHFALIRIILNCITLCLTAGLLCALTFGMDSRDGITLEYYFFHLTIAPILTVYLFLQIVSWSCSQLTTLITVLLTYMALFIIFCEFYFYSPWAPMGTLIEARYLLILIGILTILCVLLSGHALRSARADESPFGLSWSPNIIRSLSDRLAPSSDQESTPFHSPQEAQRWLEKTSMLHYYKYPTALFLGLCGITISWIVFVDPNHNAHWMSSRALSMMGAVLTSFIGLAILVGITHSVMRMKQSTKDFTQSFVFTRPITSKEMALARIHATLSIWKRPTLLLISIGILFGVFSLYWNWGTIAMNEDLSPSSYATDLISAGLLTLTLVLAVAWCITWLLHTSLLVVTFYLLGSVGATLCLVFNTPYNIDGVALLLGFMAPLPITVAIWGYSLKKGIVSLPKHIGLLLLGAGLVFTMVFNYQHEYILMDVLDIIIPFAILGSFPFASIPAVIHWTRHR